MPSFGMLHHVARARTNVSEECSTSVIRVTRIGELGTMLAVTSMSNSGGIKIASRSYGNVSQFKYFGKAVTNQNMIPEGIKIRLNSDNACYHSVQNLVFPGLTN
jgi:hypothetical protein